MLKAAGYFNFGLFALSCAISVLSGLVLAWAAARARSAASRLAGASIEGLIAEKDGNIRDVNAALCAMADIKAASLIGQPLTALIRGLSLTVLGQPGEYELIHADGSPRAVEVVWRDGPNADSHIVAVRQLPAEKAAQYQLRQLGQFDPLTGLGNTEMLEDQLLKVLALAERATVGVAVLSVELDSFDNVRDAVGPLAADQIVIHAARRLRRCVRDTDTVARQGPQTFGIILPLVDRPADAAMLAERIVADMALPFDDALGQPLNLSVSVGVALYPGGGSTPAEMLRSAGRALFRAHQEGPGAWRYAEPKLDVSQRERRLLEEDLRIALRDGQITIAWQPIIDTATMQPAGFEASANWDQPGRGPVSPAKFIPAAEACGLIMPLIRSVLTAACNEAAGWPQPGILALSLLPQHFAQPGIVEVVQQALRDTGLRANRLELGIAESTLTQDVRAASDILNGLKALGIRIAMDDFAAGWSSLTYLRRFGFDKIKLGRGFVSEIDGVNADAEAVVRAIIAMARSLRLDVAADGIDTADQLARLKSLGCGFAQGRFPKGDGVQEPRELQVSAPARSTAQSG